MSRRASEGRGIDTGNIDIGNVDVSTDVAIIGAGPAGSALAILLAKGGARVLLLDRDRFPRHKLCGEFLSATSRSVLRALDVEPDLTHLRPPVIRNALFQGPTASAVSFPLPQPAWGVSRWSLDHLLITQATTLGVEFREGTAVRSIERRASSYRIRSVQGEAFEARIVVGAFGRFSSLHRELGHHPQPGRWVGFKRHHRWRQPLSAGPLQGTIEVYPFAGGYCGVSAVESGTVNVCALLEQSLLRDRRHGGWQGFLDLVAARNIPLAERLAQLEPSGELHTVAGVSLATGPSSHPPESSLLIPTIGDAGGMIAPLYGDGQGIALRSAQLLSRLILETTRCTDSTDSTVCNTNKLTSEWRRVWRREFSARLRAARTFHRLLTHPRWCRWALACARIAPEVASRFASWHTDASTAGEIAP